MKLSADLNSNEGLRNLNRKPPTGSIIRVSQMFDNEMSVSKEKKMVYFISLFFSAAPQK